ITSTVPTRPSPAMPANRSPWRTVTRPASPRWATLRRVQPTQPSVRSVAQTRAAGTWTAMAQARLPAPQQTSMTRAPSPAACTFSMAVRPSSSVSGRGTSAPAPHSSSSPRNVWRPASRLRATSISGWSFTDIASSLQVGLLDLAGGGRGQVGHDVDVLRDHEVLEPRLALALDVLAGQRHAGLEHHERLHRLAEDVVGDPDHGGVAHTADVVEDVLDFLRRDLLAARLDDVVHPPDEIEIALVVETAEVAGVQHHLARQRPRLQLLRGRLRLLPVAAHHRGAADHQLPHRVRPDLVAVLVDQPQLGVGDG